MGANLEIFTELAATGYLNFFHNLPSASSLSEQISKWENDGSNQPAHIFRLSSAA